MAATFSWGQDLGAATGSPARGTSTTSSFTTADWKSADTVVTYTSNPITAGNNSYHLYVYGIFTGTYNQLSAGLWSPHTAPAGALATGLTLVGKVTSTYATPATTVLAGATDYTTAVAIGSGATVLFSTNSLPATGSPAASQTANPSATQYLVTQLQTSGSAAAGDIASVTQTLQYAEN